MDPRSLLDPRGARRGNHQPFPLSSDRILNFHSIMSQLPGSLSPHANPGSHHFPSHAPEHPAHSLMEHGEAMQQEQNARPAPQIQQYDSRMLLNPKSVPKRPASEQEPERGREIGQATPGQVSLVERLHNVHERTASPAKRARTNEEHQNKLHQSNIGSAGALDLKQNNPKPTATRGPAIDLTMSKT